MESNKKATFSQMRERARLKAGYEKELDKLFIESGDFSGKQNGLTNAVRSLTTVLEHYVLTEYKRIVRDTDDEDMDYFDEVVTGVCDSIEYIARMYELHEAVDYWRKELREKGVNHE